MTGPAGEQARASILAWRQTLDATWQRLAGTVPDPLPWPTPDRGAGPHGSDPLNPNDPRFDVHAAALAGGHAVAGMWPNGSRLLLHYLGNTGAPLAVNVDDVLRDVPPLPVPGQEAKPSLTQVVNQQLVDRLRSEAERARVDGTYGVPQTFATPWTTYNIAREQNEDWHLALGNGEYSVSGVATVHPPDRPDGPPRVEVQYQVHLYDRYNWDVDVAGKQALIGGFLPAPDRLLGPLHTGGLAQEFDAYGSSTTRTYSGEVR
jgi:hypothetical protein